MIETKASEMLSQILAEVQSTKALIKLQNFQYTLILKKLNDLGRNTVGQDIPTPITPGGMVKAVEQPPPLPVVTGTVPQQKRAEITPQEPKIFETTVKIDPAKRSRVGQQPNVNSKDYDFGSKPEEFTTIDATNESFAQVPVTQVIYTSGGKPVAQAMVEIKTPDGNTVNNVKTNSGGRWQALLVPGKYVTHVLRKYNTETIEFEQPFEIGPSSKQIEVPAPPAFRKRSNTQLKA